MENYDIRLKTPAKINYFLEIGEKRKDGYHEISTVFQTVSLYDTLYFREAPREIIVESNNETIGPGAKNLVFRAAELLKRMLKLEKGAHIFLDKQIPIGAGLGGGSGNAAGTLKGLSRLWKLNLSKAELYKFAANLGADVSFFIEGGLSIGKGKGDVITPISRGLKPKLPLLIICPDFEISSTWAYKVWDEEMFTSREGGYDDFLKALYSNNINSIAENLYNDFENVVATKYPWILKIKETLKKNGALGTLMSGSGSAVFGVFKNEEAIDAVIEKLRYLGKTYKVHTT